MIGNVNNGRLSRLGEPACSRYPLSSALLRRSSLAAGDPSRKPLSKSISLVWQYRHTRTSHESPGADQDLHTQTHSLCTPLQFHALASRQGRHTLDDTPRPSDSTALKALHSQPRERIVSISSQSDCPASVSRDEENRHSEGARAQVELGATYRQAHRLVPHRLFYHRHTQKDML